MPPEYLDTELEELYKEHSSVLYAWLIQQTGSDEMAADILQDTFINYYRVRQKREQPTNVRAYLFMIARNNHLKQLRRNELKFQNMPLENLPAQNTDRAAELEEIREVVNQTIEQDLVGLEKETMGYRFDQGFTTAEIAQIVKKSERTIRRTLQAAGVNLRRALEKRGYRLGDL